MEVHDKIYIDGDWVASSGGGTLEVVDSTSEEVMATIPAGTPEDVDRAVRAAAASFPAWSKTSHEERAKALIRIGEALAARTDEIASIISHELGMPERCRDRFRWACRQARLPTPLRRPRRSAGKR